MWRLQKRESREVAPTSCLGWLYRTQILGVTGYVGLSPLAVAGHPIGPEVATHTRIAEPFWVDGWRYRAHVPANTWKLKISTMRN